MITQIEKLLLMDKYGSINQKNIYSSFVGINTANNYIYARNHSFKEMVIM